MALAGPWLAAVFLMAQVITLSAYAEDAPDPSDASDLNCTEDAMLILDASGSMVQKDKTGEPLLQGAREATRTVVPVAAQHRKMGLVTLGPGQGDQCSNVELRVPVQAAAAQSIIGEVEKLPADGGTPLSKAVEAGADALNYTHRSAVMVVVSDGDETCGRDPCEVARQLRASARDLTIHVIGFGPDGATSRASCLATETKGRSVAAKDAAELTTALRQTLTCPQISSANPSVTGSIEKSTSR